MEQNVFWGLHSLSGSSQVIGNPTLLLVGDSWFWYPFNNLAGELGSQLQDNHTLLVLGNNGAEAQEWSTRYRKTIDLAFKWYAATAQGLLLSGGGNDIAGSDDFDPIVEDDCEAATTVGACYSPGQPDALLTRVQSSYREIIGKFRKYNPSAPVFCHNYERAWPTGKGLFGPADWLKEPMDRARIPTPLRHPLFADLLERLHARQVELAAPAMGLGTVVAIASAGTLPDSADIWANELHLMPAAYDAMVKQAWLPVLASHGIK